MTKRRIKKMLHKVWIISGFTGMGKTAFDPDRIPRLGQREREFIDKRNIMHDICKLKKDAFRNACIDVLGEDPETDWI